MRDKNIDAIIKKLVQLIHDHFNNEKEAITLRKNFLPKEIKNILDIELTGKGASATTINSLIDAVAQNSVVADHPLFMTQMYGKQQPVAILGDILTTLLNTSMYTYEVAPVMTLIEKECIKNLCRFVWHDASVNDGIFTPGGSISNMMAMSLALQEKFPDSKNKGLFKTKRFSIFISDQAHYSFTKGSLFLGFGKESIEVIKSDKNGKIKISMLLSAIEKSRQQNKIPLMLAGVAGTTFSGAYDNLNELAAIAKEHKMWFHVDGVYGGSLLFSEKEKTKLQGINKADSVSWNLHKMLGIPLVCAVLLTKQNGQLKKAFKVSVNYLFHDNESSLDLGLKSLQCGRRVDALKLWLPWKYQGHEGFENRIDQLVLKTRIFASKISKHKELKLLGEPESAIICFRYLRDGLSLKDCNELNKRIRKIIFEEGQALFNYSIFRKTVYLRMVISDPDLSEDLMDKVISKIISVAKKLKIKKITPDLN